ncbi:MAG: SMC-Scp complex subunit ScpB [Clostridia bacterium]|nr:SMC-Scp complex subunit ScpB [Clostridia bacterium]
MKLENVKSVIESILFSAGRVVKVSELAKILEMTPEEVNTIMQALKTDYTEEARGIEIIKVDDGYQLTTKKANYDYIVQLLDNRAKPSLSSAALETLSIIAYNPRISRAEIEAIRGVNSDGTLYRLQEYNLIEEDGKLDLPGKPTAFKTTESFLKMFGLSSLDELPELPRYKLDDNEQIVLEEMDDLKSPINDEESEENGK